MSDDPPRKRMVRLPTSGDDNARATPARLKTALGRTPSQQAWLERQINDPFAARARAEGYPDRRLVPFLAEAQTLPTGHGETDVREQVR